jgi:hypothetical protein
MIRSREKLTIDPPNSSTIHRSSNKYAPGDWVVYRLYKSSTHPGPRAKRVNPLDKSDQYIYYVEKYWTVAEVLPDGHIRLMTRRGKEHIVDPNDPLLRRASFWDRLFYKGKFPDLGSINKKEDMN